MKEKASKQEAKYVSPSQHPSERCGLCRSLLHKDSTDGKPKIILIRHGATRLNGGNGVSEDRIRGWKDVDLSEEGQKEVVNLSRKFTGSGIRRVYSSDLKRAAETAQGVADAAGSELFITKVLRPWDLGEFAGQSTKVALPKIATYVRSKPDEAVPEGESFNQFKERAFQGIEKIIGDQPADITIALVTHHRIERLLHAWMEAGAPSSGEIDLDTFLQRGEDPGHSEEIEFPMDACRKVKGKVDRRGYCELFVRRRISESMVAGSGESWAP